MTYAEKLDQAYAVEIAATGGDVISTGGGFYAIALPHNSADVLITDVTGDLPVDRADQVGWLIGARYADDEDVVYFETTDTDLDSLLALIRKV